MTLPPEAWPRLKEVFEGARALPLDARPAYVAAACHGDEALRQAVETLLASHERATSFLETPAVLFDDTMSTKSLEGQCIGSYQLLARIGTGGMGEVYRARDTKLNRHVAIKLLLPAVANDPDRLARFSREAQLLASLNHPHIAQIHGLEDTGGLRALVMELVEGPTLADRIARGAIPIDEALPMATHIAEALEAAHEQGIIHRDLKPANIKIREDGTVKVLDFGLAKALDPTSGAGVDVMNSPALRVLPTQAGLVLGTAAYMSPEQARGLAVDKRTDIWAFGCVLHEMLTGRTAFPGETVSDTIAAILEREPDWAAIPSDVPASVRTLIRRCLAKDRRQRIRDISVAQFVLDDPASAPPITATIAPRPPLRRMAIPSSAWLIGVAMSGAAVWFATRATIPPPRVSRFLITPPSATAPTVSGFFRDLALTPDGTRLVYVGANGAALFVRALDQLEATPLSGLGAAFGPFVSPDGQWIGVFDGASAAALKKVAITGGPAVILGRPDGATRGASWGADGTIIFATTNVTTGLQRIAATGGAPTVLTRPNRTGGEADHLWPEILPGGQAVLYTITATTGRLDQAQVAVLDLRTGTQTVLIRGGSDARYVSSGHLLYAAAGTLRAVAFDLARLAVVGTSVAVLPQVQTTATGAANVAVAADGTLVYVPGGVATGARSSLVWVDRQGQETPLPAPPRPYVYPRLSPDGTRLAFFIRDEELDVWLWDLARATLTRVTFDQGLDTYPVWTPDGRQLLLSSERAGGRNLFAQAADGTGAITRLTESPNAQFPTSVSPDGTRLVFTETATTGSDVLQLRLDGTRAVTPLVQTPFSERNGEVSPDGRWLAYEANDSGRFEIYVRPFPDVLRAVWQVSTEGGTRPLWARNSQELFYLTATGALMRVGVTRGPTWAAAAPTRLFEGRYGAAAFHFGRTYDVSPDGRRFLMVKDSAAGDPNATPASMVVVLNWFEELKQRVPTNGK